MREIKYICTDRCITFVQRNIAEAKRYIVYRSARYRCRLAISACTQRDIVTAARYIILGEMFARDSVP